jgi:hypothetical protein
MTGDVTDNIMSETQLNGPFRAGSLVQVRSAAEILATLDVSGRLDGLPFMPEMLDLCGHTLRVFKRADKTCDSVWSPGMRRMKDAVLLWGARCDGHAHGGCEAGCLFFWKEAWLRPVAPGKEDSRSSIQVGPDADAEVIVPLCTPDDLDRATRVGTAEGEVYSCQATDIENATTPLTVPWWDVRQYAPDVRSGNVGAGHAVRVIARRLLSAIRWRVARGRIGQAVLIPTEQRFAGMYRRIAGVGTALVRGQPDGASSSALNLRPGDRVQVRSRQEIQATLDQKNRNRGLSFNAEMLRYCGGEFRVLRRVEWIINEKTGRMTTLRDCIVLDDVTCLGDFHQFCPARSTSTGARRG